MTSTSGHPLADRRFDMAQQFAERGDHAAAADVIRQALELAPRWPEGHFTLGDALMIAGAREEAIAAFQAYLALDPADSLGAGAKLALLGAAPATADLAPAYVARLFDQYAPRFDKALVEGLKYSAPAQIRAVLDVHFPARRFESCLDLGCGTGLMGAATRDKVARLEGVDLSSGMLAEAERKNIYDTLTHGDLLSALTGSSHDLILAADVLVYVGDLHPVMAAAQTALRPGGVFAFTVQAGEADFSLGADHRFSHSEVYIKSVIAVAGLTLTALEHGSFRQDRNVDVPGLLVVATKPS